MTTFSKASDYVIIRVILSHFTKSLNPLSRGGSSPRTAWCWWPSAWSGWTPQWTPQWSALPRCPQSDCPRPCLCLQAVSAPGLSWLPNESLGCPGKLRRLTECVARASSHFVLPILCLANVLFKSDKWSPQGVPPSRPARNTPRKSYSYLKQWGPGTHGAGHQALGPDIMPGPDNLTWPSTYLINVPVPSHTTANEMVQ